MAPLMVVCTNGDGSVAVVVVVVVVMGDSGTAGNGGEVAARTAGIDGEKKDSDGVAVAGDDDTGITAAGKADEAAAAGGGGGGGVGTTMNVFSNNGTSPSFIATTIFFVPYASGFVS